MSTFTYLLAAVAVVAVLSGRAECRPQTPETREVESVDGDNPRTVILEQPLGDGKHGSILGEITAYTHSLVVNKQQKKKKKQNGPSVSALVSGPPQEVSVGLSAGLSLVPSVARVEIV